MASSEIPAKERLEVMARRGPGPTAREGMGGRGHDISGPLRRFGGRPRDAQLLEPAAEGIGVQAEDLGPRPAAHSGPIGYRRGRSSLWRRSTASRVEVGRSAAGAVGLVESSASLSRSKVGPGSGEDNRRTSRTFSSSRTFPSHR